MGRLKKKAREQVNASLSDRTLDISRDLAGLDMTVRCSENQEAISTRLGRALLPLLNQAKRAMCLVADRPVQPVALEELLPSQGRFGLWDGLLKPEHEALCHDVKILLGEVDEKEAAYQRMIDVFAADLEKLHESEQPSDGRLQVLISSLKTISALQ